LLLKYWEHELLFWAGPQVQRAVEENKVSEVSIATKILSLAPAAPPKNVAVSMCEHQK
jgi:hypothetical protein